MRPTKRPERPYARAEIMEMVYQHFVVEKQPRSFNEEKNMCAYSGCGCGVGCLVTEADARTMDNELHATSIGRIYKRIHEVYRVYFDDDDLPLLCSIQAAHDQAAQTIPLPDAVTQCLTSHGFQVPA